jgi:hypothetical protein
LDSGEDCINGGRCIQRPIGDYVCSCTYPYCGLRCELQRPSCGGILLKIIFKYLHHMFTLLGMMNTVVPLTTTPSSSSACSSNLCNNRGICQQVGYGTGMQCYCSTGWSGSRCQYSKFNS